MKRKINVIAIIGFIAAISLNSCETKEQRLQKAQENVMDANDELRHAQEQFRNESDITYNKNQKVIDEFRTNIRNTKKELDAKYKLHVDSLEVRNKELNVRIKAYSEVSKERWEKFKEAFTHDMDDLSHALKELTVEKTK